MCDCFKRITELVRKETGDPEASIPQVLIIYPKAEVRPAIQVTYHPRKKDGTLAKTTKTKDLLYSYCHFCGKKLGDDVSSE